MMQKSVKSQTKKFKHAEEIPTFHSELQKICFDNELEINIVCYILNAEITPELPWTTYPLTSKVTLKEKIIIYTAFENFEKQGILNRLYVKNQKISVPFLEALFLTFTIYSTFTTIKLINCNLTSSEIEILHKILTGFRNITDLNLDGNPNTSQNFAIVLLDTRIKHLSLKRCKIDEYGLRNLSLKLHFNLSSKLVTLDLTGNYIGDDAVTHLAEALRQNRRLRTINLADNWITDVGCYEIMKSLQTFILTHNENIIKRKININYFKERARLVEEFKIIQQNSNRLLPKKHLKSDIKLAKAKYNDELNFFIKSNITQRDHPFVVDIIETLGEVHCSGNMKLAYINLAYNKISCTGYQHIIETLTYQLINEILGAGIILITLDGNKDLTSPEFYEIYRLLMAKRLRSSIASAKSTISNHRFSSKYSQ